MPRYRKHYSGESRGVAELVRHVSGTNKASIYFCGEKLLNGPGAVAEMWVVAKKASVKPDKGKRTRKSEN